MTEDRNKETGFSEKLFPEEDFMMLSGIQHFVFCRRQWALIHIEQQWSENVFTVEGNILHEKAHDGYSSEKRKDVIISRGMPIHSRTLRISGTCDIVEFHRDENGVFLPERKEKYTLFPVEYKRGKPKLSDEDRMQLTAQVMCLEEMFVTDIPEAYLYYGEIRRREKVVITEEMKAECAALLQEMHGYFARGYTPKVKKTKKCEACSLKEQCLPALENKQKVSRYVDSYLEEDNAKGESD